MMMMMMKVMGMSVDPLSFVWITLQTYKTFIFVLLFGKLCIPVFNNYFEWLLVPIQGIRPGTLGVMKHESDQTDPLDFHERGVFPL